MNKSKIEWCDHTFNPITGCFHNCPYCYARKMTSRFAGDIRLNKMAKCDYKSVETEAGRIYILDKPMLNETGHALVYPFGFEPTYHKYRLNTMGKLKNGCNVFVGAMADIFGEWVPEEWIIEVFEACKKSPQHNYMFLTKNPQRYITLAENGKLPKLDNFWYGTTATTPLDPVFTAEEYNCFISFEPLKERFGAGGMTPYINWVIIGAETGNSQTKTIPEPKWIEDIVTEARRKHIPIFMKDSLIPIIGEKNMIREYPKGLAYNPLSDKLQDKMYDNCMACRKRDEKRNMVSILARSQRSEGVKKVGFMCDECFDKMFADYNVPVPKLERRNKK